MPHTRQSQFFKGEGLLLRRLQSRQGKIRPRLVDAFFTPHGDGAAFPQSLAPAQGRGKAWTVLEAEAEEAEAVIDPTEKAKGKEKEEEEESESESRGGEEKRREGAAAKKSVLLQLQLARLRLRLRRTGARPDTGERSKDKNGELASFLGQFKQ